VTRIPRIPPYMPVILRNVSIAFLNNCVYNVNCNICICLYNILKFMRFWYAQIWKFYCYLLNWWRHTKCIVYFFWPIQWKRCTIGKISIRNYSVERCFIMITIWHPCSDSIKVIAEIVWIVLANVIYICIKSWSCVWCWYWLYSQLFLPWNYSNAVVYAHSTLCLNKFIIYCWNWHNVISINVDWCDI